MRLATIASVCTLFAANCLCADLHWIQLQSPNFEIYSTASESSTRETLQEFEQVRAFFISALPAKNLGPLPVRVIQFSGEKEFYPYRASDTAAAYYWAG